MSRRSTGCQRGTEAPGELTMEQSAKKHQHSGDQHNGLRDTVCGMAVTAESEHSAVHDGDTYRFCSARCLEKFRGI